MSDFIEDMAAEMTGTTGMPDDVGPADAVPNSIADDIEDFDRHAVEKDQEIVDDEPEEPQQGRKQTVPLAALHKERAQRQQLQQQLAAYQQQVAAMEQQRTQWEQWQQQQTTQQQLPSQPAEVKIPDFNEDPEGHVKALTQQFEQRLADLQGRQQMEQATAQLTQQVHQTSQAMATVEQEFLQQAPDYHQAFDFVQQNVKQQLAQMHPGASAAQIQELEAVACFQFVQQCQAKGINPAEFVYNRAQEMGYQANTRVPGQRATPKQSSPSLSNIPASGRSPDEKTNLRAADIVNMDSAEFDQLWKQMERESKQRPSY